MIIGVNGRFLCKPYTGIGRYMISLFREMIKLESGHKFIFAVPDVCVSVPDMCGGEGFMGEDIEIAVIPEKFKGSVGMRKTFWEQAQVPDYFLRRGVDVVHFPYPCNPWFGFDKPVVVTVHDTIPWVRKAYRRKLLTRLYQDRCKNAVRRADSVIAVSEASADDIAEVCGLKRESVKVVHNAVAEGFCLGGGGAVGGGAEGMSGVKNMEEIKKTVLKKYGLSEERPYFLYVGGFDERKNVLMITETYKKYISGGHDVDLVLVGGKAVDDKLYGSLDLICGEVGAVGGVVAVGASEGKVDKVTQRGNVICTGFVDEKDLAVLYSSCLAFVNLSRQEGFNLPLLEALCCKCPVIASDIPVHHEVAGVGALYCSPDDEKCLGEYMKKMVEDRDFYLERKRIAGSFENRFNWKDSAQKVLDIYKDVIMGASK